MLQKTMSEGEMKFECSNLSFQLIMIRWIQIGTQNLSILLSHFLISFQVFL
jgi:hypothetical protein